jgi:uncharacterized protein (DUF486 family)
VVRSRTQYGTTSRDFTRGPVELEEDGQGLRRGIWLLNAIVHWLNINPMSPLLKTALLLVASNVFMTFAWYAHLRDLKSAPLWLAIVISWGIAFFEYAIQVPANRIGYGGALTLPQLKILQEVVTLCVFVPFSIYYMNERIGWNYALAGLCMIGAVYSVFFLKA